jgi:hypothetical protein
MNSKIALSLILSASSVFAMYDAYPECKPTTTTVTVTVEVTPDFCSAVEPTLISSSTPCFTETFEPTLTVETTDTPTPEPTDDCGDETSTEGPTYSPTCTPTGTVTACPDYGYGYGYEESEEVLPTSDSETDPNISNESHLMTSLSAIIMGSLLMLL